jgi:hypothetical protein
MRPNFVVKPLIKILVSNIYMPSEEHAPSMENKPKAWWQHRWLWMVLTLAIVIGIILLILWSVNWPPFAGKKDSDDDSNKKQCKHIWKNKKCLPGSDNKKNASDDDTGKGECCVYKSKCGSWTDADCPPKKVKIPKAKIKNSYKTEDECCVKHDDDSKDSKDSKDSCGEWSDPKCDKYKNNMIRKTSNVNKSDRSKEKCCVYKDSCGSWSNDTCGKGNILKKTKILKANISKNECCVSEPPPQESVCSTPSNGKWKKSPPTSGSTFYGPDYVDCTSPYTNVKPRTHFQCNANGILLETPCVINCATPSNGSWTPYPVAINTPFSNSRFACAPPTYVQNPTDTPFNCDKSGVISPTPCVPSSAAQGSETAGYQNYVPLPIQELYDWVSGRPDLNHKDKVTLLPGYFN